MRAILIIGCLSILCISANAQLEPVFLTTVYFEDAVGNRDSIEIGYDTAVTRQNYPMASLGQVEVTGVWDTVFEVRAKNQNNYVSIAIDQPWYRRVVSGAFFIHPIYGCWIETNTSTFAIKSKYPPVTVTWKKDDYTSNFCHIGGLIAHNRVMEYYEGTSGPFWWSEYPAYLDSMSCMGEVDSWTPSLRVADPDELFVSNAYVRNNQGGIDSLFTLHMYLFPKGHIYSPCDVEFTSSVEATGEVLPNQRIIPNPATDVVSFLDGKTRSFRLFDMTGRVRMRGAGSILDLTDLEPGLYVLESEGHLERFVKQ